MDDLFLEWHELWTVHGLHALLLVSLRAVWTWLHLFVWNHSLWWTVLAAFESAFLGAVHEKSNYLVRICLRSDFSSSAGCLVQLTFRTELRRFRLQNLAVERRPLRPPVLLVAERRPRTPAGTERAPGSPAQTRSPGEKTIRVRRRIIQHTRRPFFRLNFH